MKKQMFRLTAKDDYKDENVILVKGDEVFTYRPENYDLEKLEVVEWDKKKPF